MQKCQPLSLTQQVGGLSNVTDGAKGESHIVTHIHCSRKVPLLEGQCSFQFTHPGGRVVSGVFTPVRMWLKWEIRTHQDTSTNFRLYLE